MIIRLAGKVRWTCRHDPESGWWIGECQPLQLTATAETQPELAAVIFEILDDYLSVLVAENRLDRVAAEQGWTVTRREALARTARGRRGGSDEIQMPAVELEPAFA